MLSYCVVSVHILGCGIFLIRALNDIFVGFSSMYCFSNERPKRNVPGAKITRNFLFIRRITMMQFQFINILARMGKED